MFNNDNNIGGNDFLKKLMENLKQEDSVVLSQLNDNRLFRLAEYEATQGLTMKNVPTEAYLDVFTEFKKRVKNGDFTIKALEDDVYSRWGILESSRETLTDKGSTPIGFHIDRDIKVADLDEDDERNT